MKTIRLFALVLFFSILFAPFAFAGEWDKNVILFNIGTTASGTAANSGIVRIPQSAKIDTIYVTDRLGYAVDGSNYAVVTCYLNGSANGALTSSDTALVAMTPAALTPTISNLSAGDTLQFRLTKVGTGTTTADLSVSVGIYNTTSR